MLRVRFEDVSKRYRLGLTRTSLPALLSHAARRTLGRGAARAGQGQEFWALDHVSFDLHAGKSLALVGRNGAGKTTALKLLANITKPTSGRVAVHGQLSALIELGAGFHPDLTGRENIFLNGTILGLSRRDIARRFDEMVDFAELEQFIDTPVKRYSSGMTVRLGFAVASCIEPDILLVDEVLAVGDASFQQKCMRRIRQLVDGGTSIIFVSHNFYLVQAVCERALYLRHGRVHHAGPTQDVIAVYEQDLNQERVRKFARGDEASPDGADGDVEITRVELVGLHGEEMLPSDAPLSIRVHYNAYRDLGTVHASVFITRADGLTCCMLRTKLDDVRLDVMRGQGTVTLTLDPVQLVTGAYFAEAWFLNGSDSMGITSRPGRSDWFQIRGRALSDAQTGGVFEPHATWEHAHGSTRLVSSNGHRSTVAAVRSRDGSARTND